MSLKEYSPYIIAFYATIVRYYDYALFGLSAATISKNFMPGADDNYQMLVFFATFSVSMFARPFGSIIFGRIGDKVNRIASVKIATILAAISTGLIAIIPPFEYIGWYSVILLVICRMLFLSSLVGEMDAIKIYVAERVGKKNRYLASGMISFSSQIGVLFASMMYHIAVSFEEIQWLWRGNFFLGGVLGLFIIMMRGYLQESDVFLKNKSTVREDHSDAGIITIISNNKMKFTLAMIINGMIGGGYNFLVIFLGTFAANVADVISLEQASLGNVIIIALYGVSCLLSGYIADKIDSAKQILVSVSCSIICVSIMEFMLARGEFIGYLHYMLAFLAPFYTVPGIIKMQSLFATGVRMRMFSLSHSLGSLIFSSTTPFICMLIWVQSRSFLMVLTYFLVQLGVLFAVFIAVTRRDYDNMFET